AGLGDRFLGHVERCSVLLHLVDGTQDDVVEAYRTIRGELEAYGGGLGEKEEVLALNKVDALSPEDRAEKLEALEKASGGPVLTLSGATGENVEAVLYALLEVIDHAKENEA